MFGSRVPSKFKLGPCKTRTLREFDAGEGRTLPPSGGNHDNQFAVISVFLSTFKRKCSHATWLRPERPNPGESRLPGRRPANSTAGDWQGRKESGRPAGSRSHVIPLLPCRDGQKR